MAGHAPHDTGSALDTLVVTCAAPAYGLFTWAGLVMHMAQIIPVTLAGTLVLAASDLRLGQLRKSEV